MMSGNTEGTLSMRSGYATCGFCVLTAQNLAVSEQGRTLGA